ncbi:Na+/H+ antiporter subunit E [Paracoccus nototheniae]|uniref:Na+/H+ antiporter subunit E n=1 Tax=Paracoccus nototheniae TaxID=2489002 RepID=A0ABW4DXD6_9RHOB|nr:Na+/H+ antiporter subunit E [Paracoccus nototheniae]
MTRLFPHPVLTVLLTLMWMVLTAFSVGHLLLGGALAVLAARTMAALHPETPPLRNWRLMPRLAGRIFVDVIRSNIAVARLILTEGWASDRQGAFVELPLTLRSPSALAVLAIVLTATPGTAWVEYVSDSGTLVLHVFDGAEADHYRAVIRDIYEPMLQEIFE